MIALLLSTAAWAWDVEPGPLIATPDAVTGVMMVRVDELSLIVVGMAEQTDIMTRDGHIVARLSRGWHDYALVDVDRDDSKELVLCGNQGVVVFEPLDFTSWTATTAPCDAIEPVLDDHQAELVAIASGWVRLYRPTEDGLEPARLVGNAVGKVSIAASGTRWAWADHATRHIHILGEEPVQWVLSEAPGDLISGPLGFSWTLPRQGVLEDEHGVRWPIGGSPTQLRPAHLDKDGAIDVLAMHPALDAVSITSGRGGHSELVRLHATPNAIHHRDYNGDGCDDVLVGYADPPAVQVLTTTDCSKEPVVDADEPIAIGVPAPVDTTRLFGLRVPTFHNSAALLPRESTSFRELVFGSGWAAGGALRNTRIQIPTFPALSVGLRFGGPRVRGFVGGDSAALFFWASDETRGIRLVNLTVGATVGTPRLRAGPIVTAGVWNIGAGVRAVWTPWTDAYNRTHGLELRLTALAPRTGEVLLMYVWTRPEHPRPSEDVPVLGWRRVVEDGDRVANTRPRRVDPSVARGTHRIAVGLGAAAGPSSTDADWTWTTPTSAVQWSASPVVTVQYEAFNRGLGWFVGAESAPLFAHQDRRGERHYHLGTYSMGASVGSKRVRVGPTASAGFWMLGAGARTWVQLARTRSGADHALELRAQALLPEARAAQAMLTWSMGFDPR